MPYASLPLSWVNCPPTITFDWSGAITIASTCALAAGAHGSSAPLEAWNAASRVRALPLPMLNAPPTYTVVLVTANARARKSSSGANVVISAPVAVLNAATRYRFTPLAVVNSPATYSRDPSGDPASPSTCPLSTGANEVTRAPVRMS